MTTIQELHDAELAQVEGGCCYPCFGGGAVAVSTSTSAAVAVGGWGGAAAAASSSAAAATVGFSLPKASPLASAVRPVARPCRGRPHDCVSP